MSFNEYTYTIGISTKSESVSSGDVTETWGAVVSVSAKVTQVDGTRYLEGAELVDRQVYKIELFDNGYINDIKITYGALMLYPLRPITKNLGKGSMCNEIIIIAATK